MEAIRFFFLFVIVLTVSLSGCSGKAGQQREGYVIEVKANTILIAQDISLERYNELKGVSSEGLIDQGGLGLIWLTYKKSGEFEKGDHVVFWIDGGVNESYPEQASASKVELK